MIIDKWTSAIIGFMLYFFGQGTEIFFKIIRGVELGMFEFDVLYEWCLCSITLITLIIGTLIISGDLVGSSSMSFFLFFVIGFILLSRWWMLLGFECIFVRVRLFRLELDWVGYWVVYFPEIVWDTLGSIR